MKLMTILILVIVLTAGCTQNTNTGLQKELQTYDLRILKTSWAFEDNCQYGNESVGYVFVECKKDVECEVYVNGKKSKYGLDSLQPCDHELVVAEIELDEKPDFISIASGGKYYYTRRDKNKIIEICCSYIDPSVHELQRDYEICETVRLDAQCLAFIAPTAEGFREMTVLPMEVRYNGTMDVRVKNSVGQNAVIRKIYINDMFPTIFNLAIHNGNQSQVITLTGTPTGNVGSNYSIRVSIEYYLELNPNSYFNSSGTISGTYS